MLSKKDRIITSVDLLVHPFYGTSGKRVPELPEVSYKGFAGLWEQRIKLLAHDPNALLIIVHHPLISGKPYQQKLFELARRLLKNRLIELPQGYVDAKLIKSELASRKLRLSKELEVMAYGELREACVNVAFTEFLKKFRIKFDLRKTKIVETLSMGVYLDKFTRRAVSQERAKLLQEIFFHARQHKQEKLYEGLPKPRKPDKAKKARKRPLP